MNMYVCTDATNKLLSRRASLTMELMQIDVSEAVNPSVHGDVGLSNFKPVHVKLRPNAAPYCLMTPHRVPVPSEEKVQWSYRTWSCWV